MTERYAIAYRNIDGAEIVYGVKDTLLGTTNRSGLVGLNFHDEKPNDYAEAVAQLTAMIAVWNADYAELVALREAVSKAN